MISIWCPFGLIRNRYTDLHEVLAYRGTYWPRDSSLLVGPIQMRWFVFGCLLVWGFVSCVLKVRFGLRCCI